MPVTRAVVTLPYTSLLPEDVAINTFHFITAAAHPTAAELTGMGDALVNFYNSNAVIATDNLAGFLSTLVTRASSLCTIEWFALSDPEPRLPVHQRFWTLAAADSATTWPPEMALCMSFQGQPVSGIPQARRRGRVFLGPWNATSAVADAAGARPTSQLLTAIQTAGDRLLSEATANGTPWAVYSRIGDAATPVVNGWIDNEFDILRSRGRRATSRVTFA